MLTPKSIGCNVTTMKATKGSEATTILKPKTIAILPVFHARAKASAAMKGQDLQDWVAEAIQEKLEREERARRPA
jgi:predicted HicB family RNase H-like nuclease